MRFQNLECNFSPGFLAEGRRGLAKQLVNSYSDPYIGSYTNPPIYIYILYESLYIYIYISYINPA